jgi:ferredoxin-NADP reductase
MPPPVQWLHPEVVEVDLAMEEPAALAYRAGQWISVPFGPKTVRAYSIATPSRCARRFTLCADVAPGGLGSRWLRGLAVGDAVAFKGPLGGFVYSRADPRRPLFVAEEIGIVPIRAILAELYETGFGRPAALVAWARDPGGLVYDAEFRSLARRFPAFAYHPLVGGARERLAATAAEAAGAVAGLVAYVCGGGDTIDGVRRALMARGMDRKAVRWEKFW